MTGDFDVFNISGIKWRVRYRQNFLMKFDYVFDIYHIFKSKNYRLYPYGSWFLYKLWDIKQRLNQKQVQDSEKDY